MSDHRYKLPEHIKTRQAEALKKRFAEYGRQGPSAPKEIASNLVKIIVFLLMVYALYRWRRGN